MSHALQVRFVRLDPSEELIALAAAHYKQLRRVLDAPGECIVCLEREGPLARAVVKLCERGRTRAEAHACHAEPAVALGLALTRVRERLHELSRIVAPI
ncbi:MAG TPA: hypothetical protein VFZ61_05235, partial [Polyangiales bacterium]